MEIVIVAVVMLLLLLLIKEVIQPLHALISVMFSFCFWHVVLDTFIALRQTTVRNTCVLPYAKAILISASMFYVGQWVALLLAEHNYKVLGNIVFAAVKLSFYCIGSKNFWLFYRRCRPF